MNRARVVFFALMGVVIGACVPALPGGALGEPTGSAAGASSAGAGGAAGAPPMTGSGATTGTGAATDGAVGPGAGGASGIGGPCLNLATFDAPDLQGFALNPNGPSGNLAISEGGAQATLAWSASDGSPWPGSLRVDAPFSDYSQYVDVEHQFPDAAFVNWSGYKLHVRVEVAWGGNPRPQSPAAVLVYIYNGTSQGFCGARIDAPNGSVWTDYVLDLDSCPGMGASMVIAYGVSLWSGTGMDGHGGFSPVKPTPAVIYVDDFWLEGSCTTAGSGDGGMGGAGGGAGGAPALAHSGMPAAVGIVSNRSDELSDRSDNS